MGLSDHTLGVGAAVASVVLDAITIEKRFIYSCAEGGEGSAFSDGSGKKAQRVRECEMAA